MNFPKEKFKGRDESGAGWQCDLLFGIGEQDVKTYIGGTVLAAKGWEFEDGRSYFGVCFQPGSCILPEELSIRDLVNKDLEIDGNLFGDHLTEKLAGSKKYFGACQCIYDGICKTAWKRTGGWHTKAGKLSQGENL